MIILRPGEKILQVVTRHRSTIKSVFVVPFAVIVTFFLLKDYVNFTFFGYAWQVLGGMLAIAAVYVGIRLYIWEHNVLIITNQRIIRHDQRSLFSKTVTELLYQDIADISIRKKGMSAMVSGYGTIIIRTLGDRKLVFDKVPNPEQVVEQINNVRLAGRTPEPHEPRFSQV